MKRPRSTHLRHKGEPGWIAWPQSLGAIQGVGAAYSLYKRKGEEWFMKNHVEWYRKVKTYERKLLKQTNETGISNHQRTGRVS